MTIAYSDLCLLGGDPIRNAAVLSERANGCVELMMDGGAWDNYQQFPPHFTLQLRELGICYTLHSPCWDINLSSENRYIREASLRSGLDAVGFAASLGCAYLVIHPGVRGAPCFDRVRGAELTRSALTALCQRARELGVRLAVENVGYRGTSLYTQEEFAHLLDDFGEEALYLVDTGHAALNGWDIPLLIRQLAPRLGGLHLHDNDGRTDSHQAPGNGVIDWPPVLDEMASLPATCNFVLELNIGTPPDTLQAAGAWFRRQLQNRNE